MHPDPAAFFEYRLACLDEYFDHPVVLGVYDVAAWLRQLLLDATPLMDVANRDVRHQVRFEVNTLPESLTTGLRERQGIIYSAQVCRRLSRACQLRLGTSGVTSSCRNRYS